jgi:hypothetical protein
MDGLIVVKQRYGCIVIICGSKSVLIYIYIDADSLATRLAVDTAGAVG